MIKMMFVLAIAFGMAHVSHAQISVGKYTVGGSFDFTTDPSVSFSVNPRVGYFFTENIAIGLDAGFSMSDIGGANRFGMALNPNARYYASLMDNLYVFGHAALNFGDIINNSTFGLQAYPGVAYFFNERFAIEGSLAGLNRGGIGVFLLF